MSAFRLPPRTAERLFPPVAFFAVLLTALFSLPESLRAQTPASGTVARPSPSSVTWCGGSACGAAGNQTSATANPVAATCSNSRCESFALTVGSANPGDLVSVTITWTNQLNDFDLHVFNSSGNQVASSANGAPGNSEHATFPAVAGTYTVKVLFYTVVADNYAGTAALQAGPPPRAASYVSGGITFGTNVSVRAPAAASDGEPSSRVDFQGNAYTSGIRGVPAGVDLWAFDLNSSSPAFDPQLRRPHYRGQPDSFPESGALDVGADGGGDVDLAVGFQLPSNPPAQVPNLSVVSLVAANVSSARSQDRGATFLKDPAANLIPADDRQWIEALGGDTVFLMYRAPIPATGLFVQTSTDGGFTFAPSSTSLVSASGTTPGYISVDQTRRIVYAGHQSSRAMFVGRAQFDPSNPLAPMAFKGSTVDNTTSHRHLFDVVKVGRDGTVYACWSDDTNIYLASSVDQGVTWSQKVQVNNPAFTVPDRFGVPQTVQVNLFPWCEAGSDGRVDIVWYGTTSAANNDDADWNVFFAQTLNAKDPSPTFRQVTASDHFVHAGNISEGGLTGAANRNLLDYFQVSLDPQGAAFISFADDHNDFTGHTQVTRQLNGPSVFADANGGTGTVAAVAPTAPPAQDPSAPQVIDFAHDAVAGLLAVIPTDHPLDILSIRYGCEITTDQRTLVTATMKVSDLSVVPPAANWRMNFTANAPAGLSDRGNQFFLRASTDTVTPTFTYGTTVRNSDGSLTNTTRGSADVGFFDTANRLVTLKVDIAKLNGFASPAIGPGTAFIGLRGSTFTTGANVIRDIARGGAVPVGDALQGAFSGGMGNTQFAIANCASSAPPPPPPPPPPGQKKISVSGDGHIVSNGSDDVFSFQADNRPSGQLQYQDNAAGIDLVSTAITFFEAPDGDTCVSFGGTARLNGDPNHTFTVRACDNGEPGKNTDTFSISIDSNYARSGTLTSGNIQLHEK